MSDRHLEDFETVWKGILRATEQPDSYWSWDYKLRQGNQESRYEAYAIEVDSLTQGLMFLETQWHRSQLPQRYPLVYVEALAVAPWNRRRLEDPPYLRRVGRILLLFVRPQLGIELWRSSWASRFTRIRGILSSQPNAGVWPRPGQGGLSIL